VQKSALRLHSSSCMLVVEVYESAQRMGETWTGKSIQRLLQVYCGDLIQAPFEKSPAHNGCCSLTCATLVPYQGDCTAIGSFTSLMCSDRGCSGMIAAAVKDAVCGDGLPARSSQLQQSGSELQLNTCLTSWTPHTNQGRKTEGSTRSLHRSTGKGVVTELAARQTTNPYDLSTAHTETRTRHLRAPGF
jgi:hypothetical protein